MGADPCGGYDIGQVRPHSPIAAGDGRRFRPGAYEIAIGPKEGTALASYLRGRVDKACARLASSPRASDRLAVVLRAELVAPYAVVLKTI